MEQTNNDCRFRIFISTNSLTQQHLLVGRKDSRLRYVLAHNFLRKLCYGSKKWSWLNQWMISNLRALWEGIRMPDFEVLDARIASALNKIIQNTRPKKKVSLEEMKAHKEHRFLCGRQIAYLIYDYFRVTAANDSVENYADLFTINWSCNRWYSGIRFEMWRNSVIDDENLIWWNLWRIVQIKNTRVWETQDRFGIVQYGDSSEESRTWLSQIEDDGKKKYRAEFENEEFWGQKRKLWKERRGQESGEKTAWTKNSWRLLAMGNQRAVSVLKETIAVSVTISISVQNRHSRILLRDLLRGRMRQMHREPEVPEEKVPVVECVDGLARITSKELAPIHSVKNGILQNACSTSPRMDADLGTSALMRTARLMNSKKNDDKSAVAMLKKHESYDRKVRPVVCNSSYTRLLGCVFQDMEPPKSSSILRKSSNIRKPIWCVQFTKAVVRHANIREQNPSLRMICPGDLHQRNPSAPKFEDRSQEETEWQERCARESVWRLAKNILKLKEKNEAAFFSPSENWCLPASSLKPGKREFVVDSGASMHMISKKDLNSDELETLTTSRSPTTVTTAMEKCRRMKRPQCTSKNWIYSWLWKSSRIRQQYCRSESFAMKTDILMNGSAVKNPHLI